MSAPDPTFDELLNAARLCRLWRRRYPTEYRKHFHNHENFIVFEDGRESWLIEPLGWVFRALEPNGHLAAQGHPVNVTAPVIKALGFRRINRRDAEFDVLWAATLDWAKQAKTNGLSPRNNGEREDETFFWISGSTA